MERLIDTQSIESYREFLRVKQLPCYRFVGSKAVFPDEYAGFVASAKATPKPRYRAPSWMFDYQRAITAMAVHRQKFAIFADCGLGKTPVLLEFARHAARNLPGARKVLIVSPLMVIKQTIGEATRFFGKQLPMERVAASELPAWLADPAAGQRIGITNYDALTDDLQAGCLGALILDESSMLKSHYGKWGQTCIRLGRGLEWKLCCTGTPAPNDRIEYANHAIFLDAFPTVNSFLARFFINRGQVQERWELKPHALEPFYRALSHWSIFLTNPATYGWQDNAGGIPPINVSIHDVDLTTAQRAAVYDKTNRLFVDQVGGITKRATLAQIGKGFVDGVAIGSEKPAFIKALIDSWPEESTILWCHYNAEQDQLASMFPEAANVDGSTPHAERERLVEDFKAGRRRILISKSKILGYGLNLQICTRMVFSTMQDSYEEYYQCIKRANRIGSLKALNVHIPVTEVERPMLDNVLRKANMVEEDTRVQEQLFQKAARI